MSKLSPGGFYELSQTKQVIFDNIKSIISKNYKLYGYDNLETNSVELNSILESKGEIENQIFKLYGTDGSPKNYSLRYDLTVPLARYICENQDTLVFPFKRSQIQKVWRGERQQVGRYKEFYQADIDIIGKSLNKYYEEELLQCLYKTITDIFGYLNCNLTPEVHINSKEILDSLCSYLKLEKDEQFEFYLFLDKYYKISDREKEEGLKKYKLKSLSLDYILDLNLKGSSEIKELITTLTNLGISVVYDLTIVRGLDYYTGFVFETYIKEYLEIGSICSGGKYQNLTSKIDKKLSFLEGIGGSIGLTRLFSRLDSLGFIGNSKKDQIFIFNIGTFSNYKRQIINMLRLENIALDIYYNDDNLKKQFTYIEKNNYKYGLFIGESEEITKTVVLKNLDTKEQTIIKLEDIIDTLKSRLNKNNSKTY